MNEDRDLRDLIITLSADFRNMQARFEEHIELTVKHEHELFGNAGQNGMRARIRTLEEKELKRERHFFVIYPLIVGAFLKAWWSDFFK